MSESNNDIGSESGPAAENDTSDDYKASSPQDIALNRQSNLIRGIYMFFFFWCVYLASLVFFTVVVVNFVINVLSNQPYDSLKLLGKRIAAYLQQCYMFLTYNSEDKPFPFSDWPE